MSRIAITGATGLIGGALTEALEADGHTVHRITRSPQAAGANDIVWDVEAGAIEVTKLEGVDAVVHLAAEPIGGARPTAEVKRRILESRRLGTRLIAETLAELDAPPRVLVSTSAVGIYGDRGEDPLTEDADLGDDFLAEVCKVWESSADPARDAGIRVVHTRTGVVIVQGGPLLDKLLPPFKLGVGGAVGAGGQYVPWISFEDEIRALRFVMDHELEGPVNLVAPAETTNLEMTKALGRVLRRPTVLRIPGFAIRVLYGGMAESLATFSQRVVPERLEQAGFDFRHRSIEEALRLALDRPAAA
jgi:uncharacterized protein